ncbi:hypothetical protein [Brevibacterium spongiae]|uniref:Uncharacterized protein n=1 Tax=Brevibacterium spongiae TaxID=2909672 RepID=A0ABY5SRV5_9MICO|nr:hypothetical protein [Brevibacterium spongiae]UVI37288.1 hypothetical protein L1F31_06475 [Brevibacterium spongiae]
MPYLLLTSDRVPQQISSVDDDVVRTQPGPAVIISSPEAVAAAADESTDKTVTPADAPIAEAGPPRGRPLAFREAGGEWQEVGFEAADHWEQMTDELRSRLVADHLATLDVAEFKIATNGGSASIITNNWVYSGSPRTYRVAGQLRDFVTVLGELSRDSAS